MNLSYFQDDFLHHFVRRPKRRPPIINRGAVLRLVVLPATKLLGLGHFPAVERVGQLLFCHVAASEV